MSRGRWAETVVMKQGTGAPMTLFPVKIKAATYQSGIEWGRLGTPEEACAKAELSRMLQVYERYGAVQQPLRYRNGHVVWTVNFPPGGRWQNGPEQPLAWLAMLENYVRNGRFKGFMDSFESEAMRLAANGTMLRKLDEIVKESTVKDLKDTRETQQEAIERFTHATQGAS